MPLWISKREYLPMPSRMVTFLYIPAEFRASHEYVPTSSEVTPLIVSMDRNS